MKTEMVMVMLVRVTEVMMVMIKLVRVTEVTMAMVMKG